MLRARLLTAAVAVPLLVALVCCAPVWLFAAVLLGCTGLGLYEYFSLARVQNPLPPALGLAWGMAVAFSMLPPHASLAGAALVAGLFITFCVALRDAQPARAVGGISVALLGVMYIGFLLPHLILVRRGPDGAAWVFFVLLAAMLGDTGGYAVGRVWGKRQLIPHISPGKTVEGSLGAVLGNLCAAGLSWMWLLPQRSLGEVICLALIVGCLAQVGDLCESAVKRAFGAKDSGGFFPGHGGMLDRIDSLLFPGAFIHYYVMIWG
ncbi:MAG: phosphatidate cytidylyltransferase [Candidatus Binatia bacterium]